MAPIGSAPIFDGPNFQSMYSSATQRYSNRCPFARHFRLVARIRHVSMHCAIESSVAAAVVAVAVVVVAAVAVAMPQH